VSTRVQQQKSVRTHATSCVGKTSLKNCQILENLLEILRFPSPISRFPSPILRFPSPKIQFSSHEIRFSPIGFLLSSTAFRFLQRLSDFLQRLSAFFNGFPTFFNDFQFSSTAFCFPRNPRKSIYGGKYMKDHYLSFVFPATRSPSFVIPTTLSTSPQHTPVVHLCSQQCAKSKI
jgi:hypothetical protein